MFIHAVFGASMLIYPITFIKTAWKKLCFSGVMFLTPLIFFRSYYTETTMDAIMETIFAFILIIWFFGTGSKFEIAMCSISAFVLSLVKSTGVIFAVFAVIIILVDVCVGTKIKELKKRDVLCFTMPLVMAVAAKISWSLHLLIMNVPRLWSAEAFSMQALKNLVVNGEPAYRVQTVKNFFLNVFINCDYGTYIKFPFFVYVFIIGIIAFFIKRFLEDSKKLKLKKMVSTIYVISAMFAIMMLFTYLFSFSELEATYVAAIARYLGSLFVGFFIFLSSLFVFVLEKANAKKSFKMSVLSAVVIVGISTVPTIYAIKELIFVPSATQYTINSHAKYVQADKIISEISKEKEYSVRLINQEDYAFTYHRMEYESAPHTYKILGKTSIYNKTQIEGEDIWSEHYTEKRLHDELYNNFEYVYIFSINENFHKEYSSLFYDTNDIQKNSLYKVEKQSDGTVKLAYQKSAEIH